MGVYIEMSYAKVVKAEKIAREIEWLEFEREYNREKVQNDFKNLMMKLDGEKREKSEFEKVMEVLKVEKVWMKRNWADMEEEGDVMSW